MYIICIYTLIRCVWPLFLLDTGIGNHWANGKIIHIYGRVQTNMFKFISPFQHIYTYICIYIHIIPCS